jgi:hypothetical protein
VRREVREVCVCVCVCVCQLKVVPNESSEGNLKRGEGAVADRNFSFCNDANCCTNMTAEGRPWDCCGCRSCTALQDATGLYGVISQKAALFTSHSCENLRCNTEREKEREREL